MTRIYTFATELSQVRERTPELERFLDSQRGLWSDTANQAKEFTQDIKTIEQEYLTQQKRTIKHKLKDHWIPEKIDQFHALLDRLDVNYRQREDFRAIHQSKILNKKGQLNAVVKMRDGLDVATFTLLTIPGLCFGGAGVGIGMYLHILGSLALNVDPRNNMGYSTLAGGLLGLSLFAKGLMYQKINNPFLSTSIEIENRTNYLNKFFSGEKAK